MKILISLLLLVVFSASFADESISFSPTSTLRFTTAEEGAAVLGSSDDFTQAMSPLDRALRMGKNDVSEEELREFLAVQSLPWTEKEITRISGLATTLASRLEGLSLKLPAEVLMVKTTGRDEFSAPYTRQNAIIFPESFLTASDDMIVSTLAHELFHVLSLANPEYRDEFYRIIGFTPCDAFTFPASLADIKLTNPDAPLTRYNIEVKVDNKTIQVVPVLFIEAKIDPRERKPLGELFGEGVVQFKLLAVDTSIGGCKAITRNERPVLYDVSEVEGFFEQVGRNTEYIIHPEEILADNFLFLLRGFEVPNPAIPAGLAKTLGLQ